VEPAPVPDPDPGFISNNLEISTLSFIPNKIRDYCLKLFRNMLGLNSRIGSYIINFDQSCTLCRLSNSLPATRENFKHFFKDCFITTRLNDAFFNKFFGDVAFVSEQDKHNFLFLGLLPGSNQSTNLFIRVLCLTWTFVLWEGKLQKRIISPHSAIDSVTYYMNAMLLVSSKLRFVKDSNKNFSVCRDWNRNGREEGDG
jgi:hypothetical protein